MKKITLMAAAALMLGVTSCSHDDDYKMETTYLVRTYSMVTDSKGVSTVSPTTYAFNMDMANGTCSMAVNNLILDGVPATATTKTMPFVGRTVTLGDKNDSQNQWYGVFYLMEAMDASNPEDANSRKITNFMGDITSACNALNPNLLAKLQSQLRVDPIIYPAANATSSIYTETQYSIDDYRVMTFWCDMLYTGTTSCMSSESGATYNDKDGVIRVYLNLEKASEYKATVYFYNYRFSDSQDVEPVDMKLADVPVTFDRNGFTISGSGLVPVSIKDKKELPEYTMNNFQLNSTDNMTGVSCRFTLFNKTAVSFGGVGVYGYDIKDLL